MSQQTIHARFAPSPTGELHIGTLRTALFNWVFTKQQKGTFILRIEDTDLERSDKKYEGGIIDGMNWVGLDYDEGPDKKSESGGLSYRQSERIIEGVYEKVANELLQIDHAYRCFCTNEEITNERKLAKGSHKPYVYSQKCLTLSQEDIKQKVADKVPYTIRFKMPKKILKFHDLIRGEIEFDTSLISDFVIIKSDKTPTYNFSAVVDDWKMAITHVIRGEDHISNTPRQMAIYEALGIQLPQFAHLPMILGTDKSKLSKRHGATSITTYRDQGYLAEAFFNYLMLLGWSPGDNQEILTVDEIIKRFNFSQVGKAGAVFDIKKLKWMNGQYIRKRSPEELYSAVKPFISETNKQKLSKIYSESQQQAIVTSLRDNLEVLSDINDYIQVYSNDEQDYQKRIQEKFQERFQEKTQEKTNQKGWAEQDNQIIKLFLKEIQEIRETFTPEEIDKIISEIMTTLTCGKGKVCKPIRLACTGFQSGPNLLECLTILGCERLIKRLTIVSEIVRT